MNGMNKKSTSDMKLKSQLTVSGLSLARDLCASGKSLSEAASMAGFGDYSGFYRTYVKEYGVRPKSKIIK